MEQRSETIGRRRMLVGGALTGAAALAFPPARAWAASEDLSDSIEVNLARTSVQAFGAKGDGVTDDTAAIQTAIDAVKDSGGVVFLDVGTYLVSAQLNSYQGVIIEGAGRKGTLLKYTASQDYCIQVTGDASGANNLRFGGGVKHLQIWTQTAGGSGIRLLGTRNIILEDLAVDGRSRAVYGIRVQSDATSSTSNMIINSHLTRCPDSGVSFDGTVSFCTRNYMQNLQIQDCGNALRFTSSSTNQSVHVAIAGADTGVRLEGISKNNWLHVFMENSATNSALIEAGSNNNVLLGSLGSDPISDSGARNTFLTIRGFNFGQDVTFGRALQHKGLKVGFYGVTPVARASGTRCPARRQRYRPKLMPRSY